MIEVRLHHDFESLPVAELEALNLESRRSSPFSAPGWLRAFAATDTEYLSLGATPWLLEARDWQRAVGFLPLKLTVDGNGRKLTHFNTLELERPQAVARPADEDRVAHAFYRFLVHRQREWDLLELPQQDKDSALYRGPTDANGLWLRRRPDRENNIVPLSPGGLPAYVAALPQKMRWNAKKQLGALFARPDLSVLTGWKPNSRAPLFELLLEVERRSWKPRSAAGVGSRDGTYRQVMAGAFDAFSFEVAVVLLGEVPIAAGIWADYGQNLYFLQSVYAEEHDALAPGSLIIWLGISAALARGRRTFNMMPDFSYYKSRWRADVLPTETLQIFRVGSRYHLKAVAGDLRRAVMAKVEKKAEGNPYKAAAGEARRLIPVDLARSRALVEQALAAGAKRVTAAELAAASPLIKPK